MNAFKVNMTGFLPNGTQTITNYTATAIFSSTIRYILLPGNLQPIVISYLLSGMINSTYPPFIDKDPNDGLYYYFATCNTSAYQSLWLRLNDTWCEIQPHTYVMDQHPTQLSFCRIGISVSYSPQVILGLLFMRNFYMIFNADTDQIGIALHNVT